MGELFREYSRPWEDLARRHIEKIWEATNRFFRLLLRKLSDDDAAENIFTFWLYPHMEKRLQLAYDKLDELLEVHKEYPITTNTQFITNNQASQRNKNQRNLEDVMRQSLSTPGQKVNVDEISRMLSDTRLKIDFDMDMIAAEEAFDNMNAYYEVLSISLLGKDYANQCVSLDCHESIHG